MQSLSNTNKDSGMSGVTYVYADKLEQFRKTAQETRRDMEHEIKRLAQLLGDNPDLPVVFTVRGDDYRAEDGNADLHSSKLEAVLGCKGWERRMFYRYEKPSQQMMTDTIAYTLRGLPDNWRELSEETLLELYNEVIPWTNVINIIAVS